MSAVLPVFALGVVVGIDLGALDDDAAAAVRDAWTDASAGPAREPDALVSADPAPGRERMLEALSQAVTLAAIGARRGELWMLHAAAVAAADGRVVVFVGPSGRGKTTAAHALGAHWGYVTDETAAIAPDGAVLPYRKPLSVIEAQADPKVQRSPSSLGLQPLPRAPLRLASIVLLDRREEASGIATVEDVDLGDALEELVAQTSYLPALSSPLQTVAAHVAGAGGVRRVVYRDAASLAPAVEALLAASPAGAAPRVSSRPPGLVAPKPARDVADAVPTYTRTPTVDALELDDPDRLALLRVDEADAGTVLVLSGIAPALWRAADGASVDDLTAAAVAAHGAPEGTDAAAAVASAVDELVAAGVLVRDGEAWWRVGDDVAWTGGSDRVVALDLSLPSASPRALEDSAALIWTALAEGPAPLSAIIARVSEAAGMPPEAVSADVEAFLDELARLGLASH